MTDVSPGPVSVVVDSEAGIVAARQAGRKMAEDLGFRRSDLTLVATAISEMARNILKYARSGTVRLSVVRSGSRQGLEVQVEDEGPGIADIEAAMRDGFSTGGGLGLGLPGARRLMDEFDLWSEPGKGTRITMRKWVR